MILHLENQNGDVLFSNVPNNCIECVKKRSFETRMQVSECEGSGTVKRRAFVRSKYGSVYFCGDEAAVRKSRRLVRERLWFYSELLPELEKTRKAIEQTVSKHTRRLIHNLITQNAHNIQEIYEVASQEVLSLPMAQQIETVRKTLQENPNAAAKAFLKINKNNVAMKSEFSVFKWLYDASNPVMHRRMHKIRKVLMNTLHLFFQDFLDKNVFIHVDSCDVSVEMDYETVQVALYHLIDNAVKYVLTDTRFDVRFPIVNGKQCVTFDMVSLEITDHDFEKMYEEGYSGVFPKALRIAGGGFGMGIVRDLLKLNDAEIVIRRNVDFLKKTDATLGTYQNNQFEIVFGRPM